MLTAEKPNKKHRINYALAATLIASGASLAQAAERSGAANALTLKTCLRRKGLTFNAIRNSEGNLDNMQRVATRAVSQASEALRAQFGDILAAHGAALAKVPAKRNLAHIRKVGEAFEPLARTAKIVHDWGSSQSVGIVSLGVVTQAEAEEAEQPAIEIGSTPPVPVIEPPK